MFWCCWKDIYALRIMDNDSHSQKMHHKLIPIWNHVKSINFEIWLQIVCWTSVEVVWQFGRFLSHLIIIVKHLVNWILCPMLRLKYSMSNFIMLTTSLPDILRCSGGSISKFWFYAFFRYETFFEQTEVVRQLASEISFILYL